MANQYTPDPPPSISAAELRRRLLASTPPPLGVPSAMPVDHSSPPETASTGSIISSTEEMLRKLRMPSVASQIAGPSVTDEPAAGFVPKVGNKWATPGSRYTPGASSYSADIPSTDGPSPEVLRLKSENKELRVLLGEMKHLLQEASDTEQVFARAKQEHQNQIAEKQQAVDELSGQLQQIEEQISAGTLGHTTPSGPPKTKTELEDWADELEQEAARQNQERTQLQDERKQLRDDEESLEKQMRDMEVSMARERALMARQETELKRLSAEIQHELEIMQRGDATLREQMSKFQRRAQEVLTTKPGQNGGGSGAQNWPRRN